ncbi:LysR family transcriptional regulator [Mycobacterium simiae]|uniref:LysR family transcriptional regulator n=1 Tax=Mycobacterium simiae TaxID=1784 RepID=A0A5B1BR85_MYCSI|nr:LysR family transcriptional regulator [Mycobacterium simiae]KAA1250906.1 LysR family transcriptional regulator [Mycobacterium simiae]
MALSSRMPELGSFEIFHAVAVTGSLGGAARRLGLTQQAVSRRLASLEARVGLTLACRTPQGSHLTPAGVVVAESAARVLEVAHQADEVLDSLRNERRQRIRVVASETIAEQLMPHWLLSLQATASGPGSTTPHVMVTDTNSENAIASVRDGTADLGFVENPDPPVGLGHCVVGHDELVVVVPQGHKWTRHSRVVSARELAQTPLVTREPRSRLRDTLTTALCQALGDTVQQAPPALGLGSAAAMRAAVLAGAGPAIISRLAVADDLASGRLHAITIPELDLRRTLRAIWVGGRIPPTAIRSLLDHVMTSTSNQAHRHRSSNLPGRSPKFGC